MPEFLSPGVFIEEVDAGPKPIEGVSTSNAGAVGVTTFGPTSGKPVLVTSFAEFVRIFGPPVPEPPEPLLTQWAGDKDRGRWWQFALSIKGFFDNGGQRIFVKRVFSKNGAAAATIELGQGLVSEIEANAGVGATSLKLRHLIGIAKESRVKIFAPGEPPIQISEHVVDSYSPVGNTINLRSGLTKPVVAGRNFVQIHPRLVPPPATFTLLAKAKGAWGNGLQARMRPMVGATARLLPDPVTGGNAFQTSVSDSSVTWVIEVSDVTGLSDGAKVIIKGQEYQIKVDPPTNTFEVHAKPPTDVVAAITEALGEARLRQGHQVIAEALGNTDAIKLNEVTNIEVGDRIEMKGDPYTVTEVSEAQQTLKVTPNLREIMDRGVQVILLKPKPETVFIETGTTPTVAGSTTAVIKLGNAGALAVGDRIQVNGGNHRVVAISSAGVAVKPEFTTAPSPGLQVKKFKLLASAGPLRQNIVPDASEFTEGDKIIFETTRKGFLIKKKAGNTLRIAPAIPLGFDWKDQKIERKMTGTEVATELAAPGDLVVNSITNLQARDEVAINGRKYTIVETIPGNPPEKPRIKVEGGFGAEVLPIKEGKLVQKVVSTVVSENTADWTLEVQDPGFRERDLVEIQGKSAVITQITNDRALSVSLRQDSVADDPFKPGTVVKLLRSATNSGVPTIIHVAGAPQLYVGAIVELDNGTQKETALVKSVNGDAVELSKSLQKDYREGDKVRVVEAQIEARNVVAGKVLQEESFTNLRLTDDKSSSFFVTALKNASSLIEAELGTAFPSDPSVLSQFPIAANGGFASLKDGEDGLDRLSIDDFVGEDGGAGNRTGIQALEDIDEVSICLAPNMWSPTIHSALILHCETLKDRFAILDPKDRLGIQDILDVKENLDSKYAALYYPWIEVRDPFLSRNVQMAPSGHMAGIYARVDVERGVHKAPANEIIRGITKIADEVTKREQDLLNPKGINALRFFPGRGNRVWGARTISSDSSWKYINVRRLFLFVEESIDEGTQFVVFEPNSDPTWARVRQTITNFLTTVWRSGALEGTTADQAFFVKCDRTTMSQDDIDNGRLICVIGIAPVKPAEFVIFKIQQLVRTSNPT